MQARAFADRVRARRAAWAGARAGKREGADGGYDWWAAVPLTGCGRTISVISDAAVQNDVDVMQWSPRQVPLSRWMCARRSRMPRSQRSQVLAADGGERLRRHHVRDVLLAAVGAEAADEVLVGEPPHRRLRRFALHLTGARRRLGRAGHRVELDAGRGLRAEVVRRLVVVAEHVLLGALLDGGEVLAPAALAACRPPVANASESTPAQPSGEKLPSARWARSIFDTHDCSAAFTRSRSLPAGIDGSASESACAPRKVSM